MFAEAAKLSDEEFAQRLQAALEAAPPPADSSTEASEDSVRDGLRIAAAVRSTFFPPDLLPYRISPPPAGAFQRILPDSHRLPGDGSGENSSLWALNEEVRAATLARLASEGSLGAVLREVSYSPDDLLPQLLREALDSPAPARFRLTNRSEAGLTTLLQISRWAGSHLPGLPATSAISRQLDLDRLLSSARHLADDKFSGRTEVLLELRTLLGLTGWRARLRPLLSSTGRAIEGSRLLSSIGCVSKGLQALLGLIDRATSRPMMLHGPGGIGKSTLVSQLILDQTTGRCSPPILFAWLDFDRPELSAREPLTLLEDILRQLALQLPEQKKNLDDLKERLSEFTSWTFEEDDYSELLETADYRQTSSSSGYEQRKQVSKLGKLLVASGIRSERRPLLLVLDTFEEVQFHHRDSLPELFEFLHQFIRLIPSTRLLVAGRRFEEHTSPIHLEDLPLTELRPKDVRRLLDKHGVPESAAAIIGSELGGNPLTLRLAMEVWKREQTAGNGWSNDPEAQRQFFRSVIGERVQGQLYRRILSHISDPTACKLACPGLVLRRITPDLIYRVLAAPCELSIPSLEHAHHAFDALAREDSLVNRDGDALIHRSDVRRDMLRLLEEKEPDRVNAIHRAAVDYYVSFNSPDHPPSTPDLASAAEEIYHRYFLDDSEEIIESRWQPGIEPYLGNALQDLPRIDLQQRLASRLGTEELGDQARRDSDDLSWERTVIPKVRRCLDHDDYCSAIALLEERRYRSPGSRLYNMHAIALARTDRLEEALDVTERGLENNMSQSESPEIHALQATAAGILRRKGDLQKAAQLYSEAAQSADRTGSTILAIDYYLHAAGIREEVGWPSDSRQALAKTIERLIGRLPPSEWIKHRNLISQAIALYRQSLPTGSTASGILDYVRKAIEGAQKRGNEPFREVEARDHAGSSSFNIHEWILETLTFDYNQDEVEMLLQEHFGVRLKEISRGGSIRNIAKDLIQWAQVTDQLVKLYQTLRRDP